MFDSIFAIPAKFDCVEIPLKTNTYKVLQTCHLSFVMSRMLTIYFYLKQTKNLNKEIFPCVRRIS